MKRHCLYWLFLLLSIGLYAQENVVEVSSDGKDFTQLKYAWRAQWTTHPTASRVDFGSFYFRRNFEMASKPDEFIIHISADNKYWLYVNGQYVGCGPESGDLAHYRYETRNIAPYLQEGKNVIAVEVINFGEYKKASQQSFQTALICQVDNKHNRPELNTGEPGWKVTQNRSRSSIPFVTDSLNGYYAAGPGDIFYARHYDGSWKETDYDDSQWLSPKPATVEFAVGRGFLYGGVWFLVPRTLPFHTDTIERFNRAFLRHKQDMPSDVTPGKKALYVVPAHSQASLLFDNGQHTIGMPEMIFSKGNNSQIKLTYAEALYLPDTTKGNRNEITNKKIMGYYDLVYPDGRDSMSYKTTAMRTYRYIQMDITTEDEPFVLHDYYGRKTAYPYNISGQFECNDEQINKIYQASCLTVQNSSFEDFIDPYYEQLQYIGDARIEALVSLSMSNDLRLLQKAIKSFDHSRTPEGLTQSRYPSYITQIIPPYSLIWIIMVNDYLKYGGDWADFHELEPGLWAVLDWFERHIDSTGLLYDLRWWNFTDWAIGYANGVPTGADNGHSATLTLQYVYAMQKLHEIYCLTGDEQKQAELSERIKRCIDAVNRHCYVTEKGLYKEAIENNVFSQHTQILGVLTDAVPSSQQAPLLADINSNTDLIQTTIYFKFYFFEALKKTGKGSMYLDCLQNWYNMLNDGLTTFAETDINPRSECHGWSASPAYHLPNIVAGIDSKDFGFNHVLIQPSLGRLKWVKSSFPHPKGVIKVYYKQNSKGLEAEIELPSGIEGTFKWEGEERTLTSGHNHFTIKSRR